MNNNYRRTTSYFHLLPDCIFTSKLVLSLVTVFILVVNPIASTAMAGSYTERLSAGSRHGCGVKTDYTLVCWGYNFYGQTSSPTGQFSQVSAGRYHSCGLKIDGTVDCWGYNYNGIYTEPSGQFIQVDAGGDHACGVKTDGTIECWGLDANNQATPPTGQFTQVSAGRYHSCGVKTDNTPDCWGSFKTARVFSIGSPSIPH
jgi:alpha-tubulin suppressor-like RCC1 family protein